MDDKKNEDYTIKMPEIEMRNFNRRNSEAQREPFLPPKARGSPTPPTLNSITNSPPISIMSYCLASISMTVTNKYCVSGKGWNLNFFYLAIQSLVCIIAITVCKQIGLIKNLAPFDSKRAKTCQHNIHSVTSVKADSDRVSYITPSSRNDLHEHKSATVLVGSCIHHI